MNRTIVYEVTKEQTVFRFLQKKGYSDQNLVDLRKDKQGILVDGIPALQKQVVRPGERLTVQLRETDCSTQILPVELPLDIVYEDEDFLVVNKPAGMPVHPSRNNVDNSLGNALMYYFLQQQKPFVYRCINRLDRDTSGLTIVAKHSVSAAILGTMLAEKSAGKNTSMKKGYLAIVRGSVTPPSGTITAPIMRKEEYHPERVVDFTRGEAAVTHYRVVGGKNGYNLVALELETGRTHQIRVHMKYLGYPLIGDSLYNPDMERIQRQALHAASLSFAHPITGKWMEFHAPMPEDMRAVFASSV